MIDTTNEVLSLVNKREQQVATLMEKLFSAAQASAVFSTPVVAGNYTVVTACEVAVGGGFGSGMGQSPAPASREQQGETPQSVSGVGVGGGGGGGGGSNGRPVAAIVIGPQGVHVRPIVDVTKIAIAGITLGGTIAVMLRKVLK